MHYTYYEAQDGSPRCLGLTSLNLKNGFSDEPKTNLHTCVLDALASICVSKPGSQVVAIALQVSSQEHTINLTIAENGYVSSKLEAHLWSVWRKLQDLSHMYEAGREEGSSKEATQRVTFPLRVAIFSEIYHYSIEKQMKRVHKWWHGLMVLFTRLIKFRKGEPPEGIEEDLCEVICVLNSIFRVVRELQIPGVGLTQDQ